MKTRITFALALVCALSLLAVYGFKARTTAASSVAPAITLYAELAKLTPQDARTRYAQLTPTERREVWRAKLNSINTDNLNNAQVRFIKTVIANLDDLAFDGTDSKEKNAESYKAALKLFGRADAGAYFGRLGNMVSLQKVGGFTSCECRVSEDFCSSTTIPWHCEYGSCSGHIGCGWLWTGYCDGLCHPGEAN